MTGFGYRYVGDNGKVKKLTKTINIWKIAFFSLLAIFIITVILLI